MTIATTLQILINESSVKAFAAMVKPIIIQAYFVVPSAISAEGNEPPTTIVVIAGERVPIATDFFFDAV